METATLFAPVAEELLRVETELSSLVRSSETVMQGLLSHILRPGGKRVRPVLTLLAGRFHDYDPHRLIPMATAVELFHIATLVHDDTIDQATLRRGLPTVNQVWNGQVSILVGDYLFAQSAELVAGTGNLRVIRRFAQTLMTVCQGELGQAFTGYDINLTQEDYLARIGRKTAALFALATESGAILSNASEMAIAALQRYGHHLGIAFQITDDILDFTSTEAELGKPVGNDLLQGTVTLPAIFAFGRYPEIRALWADGNPEDRHRAWRRTVDAVVNSPAIEESYQVASTHCQQATIALVELADGLARRALLNLADYVLERRR